MKLFVLGPQGSNAHSAAKLVFDELCRAYGNIEICFSDTNEAAFEAASRENALVLLPVENSTCGPICSIQKMLWGTHESSSHMGVLGVTELPLSYVLCAREGVSLGSVATVMSHPEVLRQCKTALNVLKEECSVLIDSADSSSVVAEQIAADSAFARVACIVREDTASFYGLEILRRKMEDNDDNATQFYLFGPKGLKEFNVVPVAKKVVGIIGINGGEGKWFRKFFESIGMEAIGSDVGTELSNKEVVEKADVVLFAVTLGASVAVMESCAPYGRANQLWLDVSSVKSPQVAAMLLSQAEVVGMHPMCAPTVPTLRGQVLVVVPARLSLYSVWLFSVLHHLGAKVKMTDAKTHDRKTGIIQNSTHATILSLAFLMLRESVDMKELSTFTSPFYKVVTSLVGRILSQNPELYLSIQTGNDIGLSMVEELHEELGALISMVKAGDLLSFQAKFKSAAALVGEHEIENATHLFDNLIAFMADLEKENCLKVTFLPGSDRPGMLAEIAGILAKHKINMSSFHAYNKERNGHVVFLIGLDARKTSEDVLCLIDEMKLVSDVSSVE